MEVKDELMDIVEKVWHKLQSLPDANPLELGAFSVIILFFAMILLLILLSCIHCCWFGKPKYQGSRVQPLHPV